NKPSQLLLYLTGASGTTPTGNAAVNISGNTIHSACGFSFDENGNTHETSMIGQNLLTRFHTFTKKIKTSDDSAPFARISILFAGDFMQLPPVLDKALYIPDTITCFSSLVENEPSKSINLWLNVNHAVQLKTQMRQIDDPFYMNILKNMRHGNLTEIQLEALRSRILSNNLIDSREWRNATFLVTKNDLRVWLNLEAVKEHAYDNNLSVIYSCAQDSYNRKILARNNRILRQIVYDQNSINTSSSHGNNIVLKDPPKYVIVEITGKKPGSYETLPSNHIPIYPIKRACVYSIWTRDRSKIHRNFQCFQLPLTPAYAFTDFKSQGRTFQKTIIDLSGKYANNSVYVMLSRAQRLNDLLILQLFNESILNMQRSFSLCAELMHIEECIQRTAQLKTWPDI
ncbi:4603_t:CDS:2, partial [Scutellospora calospora]